MLSTFTADVVRGAGRGRSLGTPTINLDPAAQASIGREGIYACWAIIDGERAPAVMHAGARPVFDDVPSVEIHLLTPPPVEIPGSLTVEVVAFLRPIEDFDSVEELQRQIQRDIDLARGTLGVDAAYAQENDL